MKSIYVPTESFKLRSEVISVNNLLSKFIDALYDHIDDRIEICIMGDNDPEFFRELTQTALKQKRIFDPFDELPVNQYRTLKHIAVINYNRSGLTEVTREIIYGNADYDISDFVRSLIFRLVTKFPKHTENKMHSDDKIIKNENTVPMQ